MKNFFKNLLDRNKLKWLMLPFPVFVLWGVFFVGHSIGFSMDSVSWWTLPYMITSVVCIIGSIIITTKVIDEYY